MDVLGHEEEGLLGVLDEGERTRLDDMLRRIMILAEEPEFRPDALRRSVNGRS